MGLACLNLHKGNKENQNGTVYFIRNTAGTDLH